jgi:hypothetical protein
MNKKYKIENLINLDITFQELFFKFNIKKYLENKDNCMLDSNEFNIILFIYINIIKYKEKEFNLKNEIEYNNFINYLDYKFLIIKMFINIYKENILDFTLKITEQNKSIKKYSQVLRTSSKK